MPPYDQVLRAVLARVPQGIRFGVDRTRAASERVGRPDRDFPVLHVAGTNGKGSVSAQCEAVLRRAGYRTGLFTSPHLCRFAERIQINGEPLDDDAIAEALDTALGLDDELSFFETAFVASLIAFREAKVDVAVLEVGLGGRLDATNIVECPLVTSVTRVAFDHMKQLGTTLEAIAMEKAAIAKRGVPMVLGLLDAPAERVVREHAIATGVSRVLGIGREVDVDRDSDGWRVRVPGVERAIGVKPSLRGAHQLENGAVAATMCAVARERLPRVTLEHIEAGIAEARWPGRLEVLSDGVGEVLIDAAHNPDGVASMVAYLRSEGSPWRCAQDTGLVFGAMEDKAWGSMLPSLSEFALHRFYVEPGGRKAAGVDELCAMRAGVGAGSVADALKAARNAVGRQGLVIVAGSIFLAGEARARLLGLERDPAVAL